MESTEGAQQTHLTLANNLFLLTHPDVDDIDKVRLRDDVISTVTQDGIITFIRSVFIIIIIFYLTNWCLDWIVDMAPLYESLGASGVLEIDQKVLDDMRVKIADELNKLDEKWDIFIYLNLIIVFVMCSNCELIC